MRFDKDPGADSPLILRQLSRAGHLPDPWASARIGKPHQRAAVADAWPNDVRQRWIRGTRDRAPAC